MRGVIKDLTGLKFTRLSVLKFSYIKNHSAFFECLCDCGNTTFVCGSHLSTNKIKSCGCYQAEKHLIRITKHGYTKGGNKPLEYHIWHSMKQRCTNPNNKAYKNYGGRGITVCDRWMNSFPNFLEDMGFKPTEKHSIDRIDNNGNYCPENCRWATIFAQHNNTSRNVFYTYNGETLTIGQFAEKYNVSSKLVYSRIKEGWSIERSITEKYNKKPVIITFNGESLNLSQWEKKLNFKTGILRGRYFQGWSTERILTEKVRPTKRIY